MTAAASAGGGEYPRPCAPPPADHACQPGKAVAGAMIHQEMPAGDRAGRPVAPGQGTDADSRVLDVRLAIAAAGEEGVGLRQQVLDFPLLDPQAVRIAFEGD